MRCEIVPDVSGVAGNALLTGTCSLGQNLPFNLLGVLMNWECFEDKHNRGDWRVEAIDFDNEGKVYVTIFSGPDARERAEEYAALKNGQESRLARIAS